MSEQYHGDLKQLCDQIERILAMKDCVEMVMLEINPIYSIFAFEIGKNDGSSS